MSTRRAATAKEQRTASEVFLDEASRRALHHFVRVLARAGRSPEGIRAEAERACADIPKAWTRRADTSRAGDSSHVLTLWFSDPSCLDPHGYPRVLPLRGPSPSIEALARRVDPEIDPRVVLARLKKGGALQRRGKGYLPRDRALIFGMPGDVTLALPGLFGLLKTLDHNAERKRSGRKRLQLFARNPQFPLSALPAFERRVRRRIRRILFEVDSEMHRYERARHPAEPTVRIGFGAYHFEEDGPPSGQGPVPGSLRRRRSRRGGAGNA